MTHVDVWGTAGVYLANALTLRDAGVDCSEVELGFGFGFWTRKLAVLKEDGREVRIAGSV